MEADGSEPSTTQFRAAVGQRLRKARDQAGLTQEQVSAKLGDGFSTASLYRWENGKEMPSLDKAATLASLYDVSLDWLVGRAQCSSLLVPGRVLIDVHATKLVEQAAENGSMRDLPPHLLRRPGIDYAWRVPDEMLILPADAAEAVERAMQTYFEYLRRRE